MSLRLKTISRNFGWRSANFTTAEILAASSSSSNMTISGCKPSVCFKLARELTVVLITSRPGRESTCCLNRKCYRRVSRCLKKHVTFPTSIIAALFGRCYGVTQPDWYPDKQLAKRAYFQLKVAACPIPVAMVSSAAHTA